MTEATYELRLRGAVSRHALSIFDEMDLRSDTLLSGVIEDQAALHGLLERIRDLGLELVDVHQIPTRDRAMSARPADDTPDRAPRTSTTRTLEES